MIDGIWWLVILLSVVAVLWLFGYLRGAKGSGSKFAQSKGKQTSSKQRPANDALQKTMQLIKKQFPDYQVSRKAKHLLVMRHGKKIAMITMDKNLAIGQRILGEVPVINFHRTPSQKQLSTDLQGIE